MLTDSEGSRSYFASLTFYERAKSPAGQNVALPKTIGVVSHWPLFTLHRAFLSELHAVAQGWVSSPVPLEAMVHAYVGRPEAGSDGAFVVRGVLVKEMAPEPQAVDLGSRILLFHSASGPMGPRP